MAHDLNRVLSIQDKIADIQIKENGVISNYILEKKPNSEEPFRRYKFDSMADFATWKEKNDKYYEKKLRSRLTPHQFYITQSGGAMERAFTGEYFWTNDVGRYDCVCCTQRLFMYDHKFINRSGYATFWNCLENAIKFLDDKTPVNKVTNAHECPTLKGKKPVKRAVCSNVSLSSVSHLLSLISFQYLLV